jgi:hypothetical protein
MSHPLFWFYLLLLFQLFVYLVNRISFHPPRSFIEPLWTIPWTLFFLLLLAVPSFWFLWGWDFTLAGIDSLSPTSRSFLGLVVLLVTAIWVNHFYWALFELKPVHAALVRLEPIPVPAHMKAPFEILEKFHIHNQIYEPELVEYELRLKGWPRAFDGFTIVQLSDLHFGKYITRDFLKASIAKARALKPDMFALTGDFINFKHEVPIMRGLLKDFKAPYGVYAVLGNHDLGADEPGLTKALKEDGIRVLNHEAVTFKRKGKTLAILGAQELWYGRKDDRDLMAVKADAKVFLAHHPDHFYLGKKLKAHLQLSGHTHGGQIRFPFIGQLIVPSSQGRKYAGGFYRENDTVLFVNHGLGCYPPLRTLCPPEIVKLVLKPA